MRTTKPAEIQILVYKKDVFIGTLSRTQGGSRFEFAAEIVGRPIESQITYNIKARSEPLETVGVNLPPYFAGLLPEGLRLKALLRNSKTSEDDLFGILVHSGSDPVGDLHFRIARPPSQKRKNRLPIEDFSELRREILRSGESLNHPVSGVQNKISGSHLSLGIKAGLSVRNKLFILKFGSEDRPDLIENEFLSLELAKMCGLRVNEARIVKDSHGEKALLVTRFDRKWISGRNTLLRFHQEDACQFLERYPADKYNLTMQEVARGLMSFCESPQIEILNLLRLSAFSYLIGNGDLHGKNISLLKDKVSELSPAYDLVCTYVYGDHQMALALDGKKDNWKRRLFIRFGERYGIPAVSIGRMLDQLGSKFKKNKDILWEAPLLASKRKTLETLFKKRLEHLQG